MNQPLWKTLNDLAEKVRGGAIELLNLLAFDLTPLRLPFLLNAAVSTAIPVATLTWLVMPNLTRLLYGWLYAGHDVGPD